MSEHFMQTITDLQSTLHEQEQAVVKTKQLINLLCEHANQPPLYPDANEAMSSSGKLSIQSDQFYGQPLAKCMREILDIRKTRGQGPATPKEIYETLLQGGFKFTTNNEANRLTGVRISLRKSSSVFHRLPDGKRYGLLAWYPNVKAEKQTNNDDDSINEDESESTKPDDDSSSSQQEDKS